ncbi:NACHT, LRR and PYD domains-containing protein 6-like [Acipenser oxyrinchus oxyrinchus]|uniref:NACHT, LRR and PYD domains-containing protein 6-like n=1 Tax=Acipenser oxyrinchus oxyrinchus TaxID=40147 RepID=A0AAD8CKQ9_ACIOX|nr:NACHT, LRR and PYD domains-containing protein 6-like [Acipenser oxyrinchus oxyrinchus]
MAGYSKDLLTEQLGDLGQVDFKRFRLKLKDYKKKKTRIPWSRLERAGVDETVELLIQYFVNQAVPVAVEVLKRCNVNNVAQELHSEWEKECKKRFEEDGPKSRKSEPHLYARPTNPAPGVSSETSPSEACAQDSPIPEDSEQDETALFMMSLQARLKRLSPVKRSIAMIDIQTILHQHEFNSS